MEVDAGAGARADAMRSGTQRGLAWAMSVVIAASAGCAPSQPARRPQEPKKRTVLESAEPSPAGEASDREVDVGRKAAREVEREMGLVNDEAMGAYVTAIGKRLAAQSARPGLPYEFHIADTPDVNAFALPGGYIYVTRGLLALANSEDELANVMAHEVGHVVARHSEQRQSRAQGVGIATSLGVIAAAVLGAGEAAAALAGLGQTVGAGYIAKYGRDQEREADTIGQKLSARSGWNPIGMSTFLESLDRDTTLRQGRRPRTNFLDDHPATPERVSAAAGRAKELEGLPRRAIAADRAAFLQKIRGIVVGDDPAQGIFRGSDFMHPDLDLFLSFPRGWIMRNTAEAVGAIAPNQLAFMKLELQGSGSDPRKTATQALEGVTGKVVRQNGFRVGDLPAYRAVVIEGESVAELTWIAHRDRMFRLTSVSAAQNYQGGYDRLFQRTARTFRSLASAERESLVRLRLDIAQVKKGESLADFSARTGNRWSLEETATANAIFAFDAIEEGSWLKFARAESPSAQPDAQSEPQAERVGAQGVGAVSGARSEVKPSEGGSRRAAPAPGPTGLEGGWHATAGGRAPAEDVGEGAQLRRLVAERRQ